MILGGPQYNQMIFELMREKVNLVWSNDFRGVMCMPDAKVNGHFHMEDVSGAVGYNNFNGRTCQMHSYCAKPHELTREFLFEIFHYPFMVCNVVEVLGTVDSTNELAKKLNYRLGFKDRAVIKDGTPTGDLIIMGLRKEDSQWLKKRRV